MDAHTILEPEMKTQPRFLFMSSSYAKMFETTKILD